MALNEALVRATVAHLRDTNTQWSQDQFGAASECGTSACFGGWAMILSGQYKVRGFEGWETSMDVPLPLSSGQIHNHARDVLGLTEDQAQEIFYFFPYDQMDFEGFDYENVPEPQWRERALELMVARVAEVTGVRDL